MSVKLSAGRADRRKHWKENCGRNMKITRREKCVRIHFINLQGTAEKIFEVTDWVSKLRSMFLFSYFPSTKIYRPQFTASRSFSVPIMLLYLSTPGYEVHKSFGLLNTDPKQVKPEVTIRSSNFIIFLYLLWNKFSRISF